MDFRELQVPTQPCPEDTAMCRFTLRAPLERKDYGGSCVLAGHTVANVAGSLSNLRRSREMPGSVSYIADSGCNYW